MSQTTPVPTRPGEPQDPELRERYLRDAESVRAARRAEAARLAAEVPPSRTPRGLIWLLAGLVTLVLVTIVGFALVGPMLKQAETSERPLSPATTHVEIDSSAGDVRVRAAEPGEQPHVTLTTEWGLRRPDVSVESAGRTAELSAECPTDLFSTCSTDWIVVVPAGAAVDVEHGAGTVDLEGLDGDIDVHAGVGDVRISETRAESIRANLGVGSLRIEAVEPPRDVEAKVGVGGVVVQLPDEVDYDVDAQSGVGDARNDLGSDPRSDRTVSLESGVGEVRLSAS